MNARTAPRHTTHPDSAGADLVAPTWWRSAARSFLANPDPVERLRGGAPLNQVRDRYLMYGGGETGCTDHPTVSGSRR